MRRYQTDDQPRVLKGFRGLGQFRHHVVGIHRVVRTHRQVSAVDSRTFQEIDDLRNGELVETLGEIDVAHRGRSLGQPDHIQNRG